MAGEYGFALTIYRPVQDILSGITTTTLIYVSKKIELCTTLIFTKVLDRALYIEKPTQMSLHQLDIYKYIHILSALWKGFNFRKRPWAPKNR